MKLNKKILRKMILEELNLLKEDKSGTAYYTPSGAPGTTKSKKRNLGINYEITYTVEPNLIFPGDTVYATEISPAPPDGFDTTFSMGIKQAVAEEYFGDRKKLHLVHFPILGIKTR